MSLRSFSVLISVAGLTVIAGSLVAAPPSRLPDRDLQPVAEPPLKLTGSSSENSTHGLLAELLAEPRGFLANAAIEERLWTGKVRAEVESGLAAAKKLLATNPAQAEQDLKLMLEQIQAVPIDLETRSQLQRQLSSAIRLSRQRRIELDQQTAAAQEQKAAASEQERLNGRLLLHEQRLQQLVDRFGSLLNERRYAVADEDVAPEVQKLAPASALEASLIAGGRMQRAVHEIEQFGQNRYSNYVHTLAQVETSLIPFPDGLPIAYLPAEQWEDLTSRRRKYRAVDLHSPSGAEQRISSELNRTTNLDVVEMPLKDVVLYLNETHGIPIVLNLKKLEEASITADTPITKSLRGITLRSALRLLLRDLELTYVVRDEVLQITTPEDAENQLLTKVYPVGDLVVPISSGGGNLFGLGGMGNSGLGGVGGGGFGGGGGGGFGGGGLGSGGFGGGGFGGGGGGAGGGGVF